MGEVVELEIPARSDYLALVRLVVGGAFALEPVADERVDDLRLAVSEACTNAIEAHAATDGQRSHIHIRCHVDSDRIEVEVRDEGGGFDPGDLSPPPPVTRPERLDFERGLGIPLSRALADEVDFQAAPRGTAVRLVVRRSIGHDQP